MKPLQSVKANGLNHDQSNGVGSGAVPAKKCHSAATTKIARARYWMPSRMFWMRSPISTPRQLTQVIAAMKTTPVDGDERDVVGEQRVLGAADDPVDQRPEVDAGDLREVREHDHAGHRDTPAAHPADPGAERLRAPRERGAAVGDRVVELAVGERDEEHRDEGDDERDRRLRADGEHDEAERRDERVDGRGGGESDDGRAPQAERAGGESLSVGSVQVDRGCSHTAKVWASPSGGQGSSARRIDWISRARKDDPDGLRACRHQPGPAAPGLAVRRERARPGEQAQLGRARRIDDEVVIRRGSRRAPASGAASRPARR